MYVVTERSHELFTYRVNDDFALCSRASILDMPAANATTAALRLSPDERFIYVSTRGTDVLSVFACTTDGASRVQQCSCGGKHPRDIMLSPCGRFLLVLNRDSNNLLAFPRDAQSGLLGAPVSEVTVHCGSGIAFLP